MHIFRLAAVEITAGSFKDLEQKGEKVRLRLCVVCCVWIEGHMIGEKTEGRKVVFRWELIISRRNRSFKQLAEAYGEWDI